MAVQVLESRSLRVKGLGLRLSMLDSPVHVDGLDEAHNRLSDGCIMQGCVAENRQPPQDGEM